MTDDATPEDLGKPPVGGPLRPDQQPPGFPDPNAPRLEFGPGSPQRDAPPRNGAQQPNSGQQQNSPGAQSGPPTGAPFAAGVPSQPGQQPNRPAGFPPAQQPAQHAPQQRGPEGFRPSAPYGQPNQNQYPNPNPDQRANSMQPPFVTGQQPPMRGPFLPAQQQPGQQQPGQQPGQRPPMQQPGQQAAPLRPGPEYGAPGQQTQQFGGAPAPKPARKPLGRRLWAGVLIGAVAASLIAVPLTLLSVGRLFTPMLDRGAVQTGVADVLKQDFGLADVEKVECPGDQPAVTGTQFECTFSYSGTSYPVAVEVINDQGQYRVGIDAPK